MSISVEMILLYSDYPARESSSTWLYNTLLFLSSLIYTHCTHSQRSPIERDHILAMKSNSDAKTIEAIQSQLIYS